MQLIIGHQQAADYLGCSVSTIKRLIDEGIFPKEETMSGVKNKRRIWNAMALDAYRKNLRPPYRPAKCPKNRSLCESVEGA